MPGAEEPYARLPYFFTDRYDLGSEYVGSLGPDGYDQVVFHGDVPGRSFTAFWLKDGRVVAGMHVNDWDAIDPIRAIVTAGRVDLPTLLRLPHAAARAGREADQPLSRSRRRSLRRVLARARVGPDRVSAVMRRPDPAARPRGVAW